MKSDYRAIVENSKKALRDAKGIHQDEIAAVDSKPTESPAFKGIKAVDAADEPWIPESPKPPESGEHEEAANDDDDEIQETPLIAYSQLFSRANVFKAMILAIECGIQSLDEVDQTLRDVLPHQNEQLKVDLPFVSATSFRWKRCGEPLSYQLSPSNLCKRFYLLSELGRGQSGKVFLACDVFGRTCALKMYLEKAEDWKQYGGAAREECKQSSEEEVEKMAVTELKRWKDLYPKFKLCCHKLTLNHQIVLKMPYFTSVPIQERLNMEVLLQVKNLLEVFQSKRLYYNDVRWRHVGCSKDENGKLAITMLDLG
jgi:hypothetical protein